MERSYHEQVSRPNAYRLWNRSPLRRLRLRSIVCCAQLAQSRETVTCLLHPTAVVDAIPYTANTLAPVVIKAAIGSSLLSRVVADLSPSLLPLSLPSVSACTLSFHRNLPCHSPLPPLPPQCYIVREKGDGACSFCAIAQPIHGAPNRHYWVWQDTVHALTANRDVSFNTITPSITTKSLVSLGLPPRTYNSNDSYLKIMADLRTSIGEHEIGTAERIHGWPVRSFFSHVPLPPLPLDSASINVLSNASSRHNDSFLRPI